MTRAASTYSARSVHGCGPTRAVVVVGEEWAQVVRSFPDGKVHIEIAIHIQKSTCFKVYMRAGLTADLYHPGQ